ncbi:flagellar motor protein MotB [Paradevosia shaoguanensis]|jgi:chemotaxis protein MotB|uniref:OmpA family protein n=1 Tax=Paradevosia shaoguanensis TaxID=1335043 RepID=A0AA41QQF8_9HYPH|nr:flagellar motor protein MotB [Paradevosia shaoguanensis]KFL25180.1 chemotaxis protein MotB [Devosia sp. 17-2-E-8]MCF1744431.1 OmpA family protein [Paradevosia shaoguanensis]MCI0128914.1 OmpA family protein [Paradevosia shaoguanensis]QMV00786.1 OmpA family protein [Devosia sp. D6-9]
MASLEQPIIIKRVKKGAHAHHGGAWKIAYADFVTAMMAFFLLLWLISMTTPEQKKGLSDYFAPNKVSQSTSGAGGFLGGRALDEVGAKMAGRSPSQQDVIATPPPSTKPGEDIAAISGIDGQKGKTNDTRSSQTEMQAKDDLAFKSAAASIRQAWQAMPDITKIQDNLLLEETPEGLNILIVDQEGRPMFPEGSKYPFELTRKAIAAIAPVLQQQSNQITISGHTAAGGSFPNQNYGPWQLTSDRANVVREILAEFGLSDDHVNTVAGRAMAEPLFPNDPYLAANERIKITLLHEPPPVPADMTP